MISYWLPPVFWGLAVLSLSGDLGSAGNSRQVLQWLLSWLAALKPAQLNLINFYFRTTGHVLAYGLMYFLWFRAFRGYADFGPWRACLWALGCSLGFALMDEGRQWFYASRGGSVRDVMLDMSGATLTALVAGAVWRPGSKTAAISGIAGGQTVGPE